MSSEDQHQYDDQLLSRYLLGGLSDEEAERLDEWSITDEEFALRLDAVENDLVDAYVRGELFGEMLDRFKNSYLSSTKRLEKVEFSRTLLRFNQKTGTTAAPETGTRDIRGSKQPDQSSNSSFPSRRFGRLGWGLQWGFAAASLLMLSVSGYLFVETQRLRKQETEACKQMTVLDQREKELERELRDQRSASAGMLKELEQLREPSTGSPGLKIVAALLLPQTRGVGQIGQIPTISITQGTDQLALRLQLEADDFPGYQVALRDPATNRILWRSPKLEAHSESDSRVVSVHLSATMLKQQRYGLELLGVSPNGAPEFISNYFFRLTMD